MAGTDGSCSGLPPPLPWPSLSANGIPWSQTLSLVGGIASLLITFYDRENLEGIVEKEETALVTVGWGLNLAVAASASLTFASGTLLILLYDRRRRRPRAGS